MVCSFGELINGVTVKTTLVFNNGTECTISQIEFKLIPDELGYIMCKNGDHYREYATRSGVVEDILKDFADACTQCNLPDNTVSPQSRRPL